LADAPIFDRVALRLAAIFPAVPAEAWTAAIRRDLKDDAEGSLAWDLGDGIRVPPYARRDDLASPPPPPARRPRARL
jgi:hypothetical protein